MKVASQTEQAEQTEANRLRDEVIRRMVNTPPKAKGGATSLSQSATKKKGATAEAAAAPKA
jgi:hypothetical protein